MSNTLGAFIRAQRERTSPSAFGLAEGRRRTPGLRREELAGLCGVSATWLAWLEQGRPVSASAKTLARLATVLKLSQAERKYLFKLADKVDPEGDVGNAQGASDQRAAGLIVDAVVVEPFGAHPSYAQGHYDRDNRAYVEWDAISRDATSLEACLDRHVHGVPDRAAYMELLGDPVRQRIRPAGSAPSGSVDYGSYA